MTRISTIHGLPPYDEWADRSANVAAKDYFPYLSMTRGQLELSILRQRAQMYAGFYPELTTYTKAVAMLDKALKDGDTGVNYVGAVPNDLQGLAATITRAVTQRQPASRSGMLTAPRMGEIIPAQQRYETCIQRSLSEKGLLTTQPNPLDTIKTKVWNTQTEVRDSLRAKCRKLFDVEQILNSGIEKSGHHMLYKTVPNGYAVPGDVRTKRILHRTGVEGMAVVGEIDASLMYMWVENGIMLKNTEAKIGPMNSTYSSLYLSTDPQQSIDGFKKWMNGQPVSAQEKWNAGKIAGIGTDPITAAIILKIAGALIAAFGFLKSLREQKDYAMVQAQGFATEAYSAGQGDWLGQSSEGGMNSGLLIALAAGGLFLATQDK